MDEQTREIKLIKIAVQGVRRSILFEIDGILSRLERLDPSEPRVAGKPRSKEYYKARRKALNAGKKWVDQKWATRTNQHPADSAGAGAGDKG